MRWPNSKSSRITTAPNTGAWAEPSSTQSCVRAPTSSTAPLYEFLRNTDLNATGFTFSPAVFQKPTLQRNQFGLTIGGPFIKNKLFFFADYEGFRQLQRYLNFDSIPTLPIVAAFCP